MARLAVLIVECVVAYTTHVYPDCPVLSDPGSSHTWPVIQNVADRDATWQFFRWVKDEEKRLRLNHSEVAAGEDRVGCPVMCVCGTSLHSIRILFNFV